MNGICENENITMRGQDTCNENEPSVVSVDKPNILDIDITSENIALNVLVTFVNLAQKRGAFDVRESAKIWQCIQQFQRKA
tara:strand:- start:3514 stop:3756 length:243 start_codon:yes stop_codon:yes gene_type:complete